MKLKEKLKVRLQFLKYRMEDFSITKSIAEFIEFHKMFNKYGREFNRICDDISYYEKEMLPEVKKLKETTGHEHFAKVELEDKILNIIDQDEGILTYQGEELYNLGMICAKAGLEKVVMRALDDPKAPLQQDIFGLNIGMFCARHGLEDCAIKALDNKEASVQQSTLGKYNIGMMCAQEGLERATIKAIENPQAVIQRETSYGKTIGLMCIETNMYGPIEKLFDLYPQTVFQKNDTGGGFETGIIYLNRFARSSSKCQKLLHKIHNIQESFNYDESVYNEFEESIKNESNQDNLSKDNEDINNLTIEAQDNETEKEI